MPSPLPRLSELGDWLHLTLTENGEDVLIQMKQIKHFTRSFNGGTLIYDDKEPVEVNESLEYVFQQIVSDECGGSNRR